MPMARLSRKFYETFGDQIANELVEWFNQVDASYRSEIRELFDINFARFDAKLEQRITQIEAKLGLRVAGFEAKVEQRLTESESRVEQRLTQSEAKTEGRITKLQTTLLTWMFVFWVTSLGTLIAIAKL